MLQDEIKHISTIWTLSSKTNAFDYTQNTQIPAVLRIVPSWPLLSLHKFLVYNDSVNGQKMPWSDCADAQADLGIRCSHIPEDAFSHGAALFMQENDSGIEYFSGIGTVRNYLRWNMHFCNIAVKVAGTLLFHKISFYLTPLTEICTYDTWTISSTALKCRNLKKM